MLCSIFRTVGMMDLKVVNDAKGGYVYRDHLPLLGQHNADLKNGVVGYQVADQVSKIFNY